MFKNGGQIVNGRNGLGSVKVSNERVICDRQCPFYSSLAWHFTAETCFCHLLSARNFLKGKTVESLKLGGLLWICSSPILTGLALERLTTDRNVKSSWHHVRQDTLLPFFLPFLGDKSEGECLVLHGINRFWRFSNSFDVSVREQ